MSIERTDGLSISRTDESNGSSGSVGVGKDNDGYITSMSIDTCLSIPKSANKIINTKIDSGKDEMLNASIELMIFLLNQKPEKISNMDCAELNNILLNKQNMSIMQLRKNMRTVIENNFNLENFGSGKAYDMYLAFKLNTPRKHQEPLSSQWEALINKYNLPRQFAMNYRDTTKEEGNVIGFRLDDKINPLIKRKTACKPGYILFKICNWGPMKDRIALDQEHFGKTNIDGTFVQATHTKQTKNPEQYKSQIGIQPMFFTLQELIKGVETGKYILDEKLTSEDRISFRPVPGVDNNPNNSNIVFSMNMTNSYRIPLADPVYAGIANTQDCQINLKRNVDVKWKVSWGSVEDSLRHEYKLQSDIAGSGVEFKDVNEIVIPLDKPTRKSCVFNPVQHSFECYNPGIQSNLDAPAIFVNPEGIPSIKADFRGHIKYLSQYCDSQVMHINHNWNMKLDSAGQLVLGQIKIANQYNQTSDVVIPIDSSAIVSFIKMLEESKYVLEEQNMLKLIKVLTCSGENGMEARISACNYLAWQLNENGQLPYKRSTVNEIISLVKVDVQDSNLLTDRSTLAIEFLMKTAKDQEERRHQKNADHPSEKDTSKNQAESKHTPKLGSL